MGADEVFVPSNGVITVNPEQIPAEKARLKGFSTNGHHTSHGKGGKSRVSFSCLVKTSECAARLVKGHDS